MIIIAITVIGTTATTEVISLVTQANGGTGYYCRYTKYHLKSKIKDIVGLLKSYHPSVWNKLSFRLAELFVDLADKSKPEKDDDHPVLNV